MAVVFRGHDPELDRDIAIKLLLRPDLWTHARARSQVLREAQAMAKLSHPNVVAIYDVGTASDEIFIAMELVEGNTLAGWLGESPRPWQDIVGG